MSQIHIENLTFGYPGSAESVFERLSLDLDTNWKTGLIGRNGRGKTTLLHLLAGDTGYSGTLRVSAPCTYFPFAVERPGDTVCAVLERAAPQAQHWEMERELSLLGMDPDELMDRAFCSLSGGERTKALLGALFASERQYLLIDEPTNHLDVRGRQSVARYLRSKSGFLLVSHDRRFLDECIDHVVAMNRSDVQVVSGTFSSWHRDFEAVQRAELTQNEHLRRDIDRLTKSADQSARWSKSVEASKRGAYDKGYVGHKAAKMMQRAKSIENRKTKAVTEKKQLLRNVETAEALKIFPEVYCKPRLCEFSGAAPVHDGLPCCEPVTFSVGRGERVVLDGPNGSGKSSLLALLENPNLSREGIVQAGSGLILSHVPQHADHLTGNVHEYAAQARIDRSLFLSILRKLDFPRELFARDMASFSDGQKKKVLLARSLSERAHLYVWDEPLNYIDIYSRIQIENLIREFEPAMLLVEHDREFRDAIDARVVPVVPAKGR